MESAMSTLSSAVYIMMAVTVLSFFLGYVVVGGLLKKRGVSRNMVVVVCKLVTLGCLVLGFSAYQTIT